MIKTILVCIILILCFATQASATVYYVDNTAGACAGNYSISNRNCTGTDGTSYNTIGAAEDAATQPGDIVYVRAGTYSERVTCGYSGSAVGGYITFASYPGEEAMTGSSHRESGTVIMRGFTVGAQDYIKIIGFEITHTDTTYSYGVSISGGTYIEVLDNYIHNVYGEGGGVQTGSGSNHITVRGNEFDYMNCPVPGITCAGNANALKTATTGESYYLFEYNKTHRHADFLLIYAQYAIVRNNYFYDYNPSYVSSDPHADVYQPGADGGNTDARYHVLDSNFAVDNIDDHAHWVLWKDTVGAGNGDVIFRLNTGINFGSLAMEYTGADRIYYYNNSFYNMMNQTSSMYNWAFTNGSIGNYLINNIIHTLGAGNDPIYIDGDCTVTASNNLCYDAGTPHVSCESTDDPLFTDTANDDLTIATGSPARNLGRYLTQANGSGTNSTDLVVDDNRFFHDGYGITNGDTIIIGSGNPVRILGFSATSGVSLSEARSWSDNDNVVIAPMLDAASPDVGAFPYKVGGYTLTASFVNSGGTVTVTPNDTSLVRFVVVYEDNIPSAPDYDSPYTFSVGSGVIKAQVYALYASSTPVITADSGAPSISSPLPYGNQACTGPTQSVTIGVTTSESATCKHDTVDHAYDVTSGVTFTTTGGTSHSGATTLASNQSYIFYATCIDVSGNTNTSGTQIYFTINACSEGGQGAAIGSGTGAVKTVAPSTPGSGAFRIQ